MKTLLALILLALPVQDEKPKTKAEPNDAEKLFQKMNQKITKAKTFQAGFATTIDVEDDEDQSGEIKGTCWFKGGEKLRVEAKGNMGGRETEMVMICDGEELQTIDGDRSRKSRTKDAPEGTAKLFRGSLSRIGLLAGMLVSPGQPGNEEPPKAEELFIVSKFKMGKKEKVGDREAQIIEYRLEIKGMEDPGSVKLWIDTETHLPLKRIFKMKVTRGDKNVTITETYRDVKSGMEIDDKKFELEDER